jgi:Holliday junction resolvase RusA-like endonuclease
VYGLPIAQGRPRAFRHPAGGIRVYDPANSRDWKRTVQAQVLPVKPDVPFAGALRLRLLFELPRPKSLPRRVVHHVKRPDVDNLAKAVKDAIRSVVYQDDSQVVELEVRKVYGDQPGVSITAEALIP